jgi:CubicO group peptidase (beta-lactamase class C family)
MYMPSTWWRRRPRIATQAPGSRGLIRAVVRLAAPLVILSAVAVLVIKSPDGANRNTRSMIEAPVDLAAVDRFLSEQIDAASIPGAAVAITHGDHVVHVAGFGHDSTGASVTGDTLFRVASLSKSLTALAVMQLVDEHRLRLDDPVVDHLPEFRLADPRGADITVRQLLQQTSGLKDSQVHELSREQPDSLADAVVALRTARLAAAPGTQWNYHNPNYQIAARLVEVVAGEPFDAYLRDHVLRPAGMSSALAVDHGDQDVPGLGDGHVVAWGHAFAVDGPHTFEAGAGGVVASAADMAQWLIVQTNHGRAADGTPVLSDQSLIEQHTPGADTHGYALGWDTDGPADAPTRLDHTGSLLTYNSYMEIVPDSGYGVVVLLNAGSGLMLDQTGIFYGVRDIVEGTNLTPPGPAGTRYNTTTLDRILGLLTLTVLLLGTSGVLRARRWARRRRHQPWILTGARTVPHVAVLAAFAAYPQLAERLIGGRDVTWEAAAYGWPALTVLVCTVLLATFATLVSRAWQMARSRTPRPTPAPTSSGSTSELGAQLGDAIAHHANTAQRLEARP